MPLTEAHLRYLLAIYEVSQTHLDISSRSIAEKLGVTKPSVVRIMNLLMERGMIVKEHYGKIYMTDRGIFVAKEVLAQLERVLQNFPPVNIELTEEERFAAALALSGEPDAVSGALALSLGIGLQNIPEGAAVSLPLAHSGRTRLQAFGAGAASGLVEPLGALAAFALAGWVQAALPWLMSAAAGCMVCVTAQEMIPEAVEQDEPAGVVSIVLGFALMMALDVAL